MKFRPAFIASTNTSRKNGKSFSNRALAPLRDFSESQVGIEERQWTRATAIDDVQRISQVESCDGDDGDGRADHADNAANDAGTRRD